MNAHTRPNSVNQPRSFRGQGIVEFALVFPLFLFLTLGLVEFGRLLYMYVNVATASREAARYGAAVGDNGHGTLYYLDCPGIEAAASRVGSQAGITASNVTIRWNLENGPHTSCADILAAGDTPTLGSTIDVTVSVPFTPLFFGTDVLPINITSSAQRSFVINVYGTP